MPKVGKKEQAILNKIARKKLSKVDDLKDMVQAKEDIKSIKPGPEPLYTTTEQLETIIDEYFQEVEQKKEHPTITGLSLKLGIDRHTLMEYKKKDMFASAINKAKKIILNYTEQLILSKDKFTPGQIFYLKNNYKQDYQDKIEIDNKHSGTVSLVELSKLADSLSEADVIEGELVEEPGEQYHQQGEAQ